MEELLGNGRSSFMDIILIFLTEGNAERIEWFVAKKENRSNLLRI